jgi:GNAT superfamily N-acetyltransferase
MVIEQREYDRDGVGELLDAMAQWERPAGHVNSLHVGDIGWHLRMDDEQLGGTIHGWWRGGELVAAALIEGAVSRARIAPVYVDDVDVCGPVAEVLDAIPHEEAWAATQPGSVLRTLLVGRGWTLDPDMWTALHVDLRDHEPFQVDGVEPTGDDVAARVNVQFNGFERSTFTEAAWHRMAAGPGYDPALDLVARDDDGVPVAGATAWSAGANRCGILEPVATHREHRRAGHGRRVVQAAINALAAAGASGAAVETPGTNEGALGLYTAAGMRKVETLQDVVRGKAEPTNPPAGDPVGDPANDPAAS